MDSKRMREIVESVKIPDTHTLYTSDIIAIMNAVNGDCCKAIAAKRLVTRSGMDFSKAREPRKQS